MYDYKGITSSLDRKYDIQTLSLKRGDVLVVKLNQDVGIEEYREIHKELVKYFPNNKILLTNDHIIEGFSVIHQEDPHLFKEIIDNDFLH